MRKEQKYFLSIVSIFSISIYFLLLLLKKYATLTFEHFLETCKIVVSSFFSTGAHYVGFILTALVLVITVGLFLKTLFSYIKTKRKLVTLLQNRIFTQPRKLEAILGRNKIGNELVIIVEDRNDFALTIDWFSPKIVISSHLVRKLNEKQLEAVVLHELYHLKNKHPLLLIIGEILSSSLTLLPVLKEITAQMRTVLEKEADRYVFRQQNTTRHLNLALERVSSRNHFKLYPTFSKRNDYKFNKFNFLVSSAIILTGILLFKFPADTHAIQAVGNSNLSNCGENLCSTHCPTDNLYQSSNTTPAFQSTFTSFNNVD